MAGHAQKDGVKKTAHKTVTGAECCDTHRLVAQKGRAHAGSGTRGTKRIPA